MPIKLALVCLGALLLNCHQTRRLEPVSVVNVADPRVAPQLLSGFYSVEANKWRWTGREFAVSLLPPAGSEERGGKVDVSLFIPEDQIKTIGPMTMHAEIDDLTLSPDTYSKGGSFSYVREIPRSRLKTNLIRVDFKFDRAIRSEGADGRELGAVVTAISLRPN